MQSKVASLRGRGQRSAGGPSPLWEFAGWPPCPGTIGDDELRRIAELLHQYAELHGGQGLSLADASVIAVAEHRGIREIATLDVTDFSLVRPRHVPRHVPHFLLLP